MSTLPPAVTAFLRKTAKVVLKAVLSNDMAAIARFSERDWAEILFLTHSGMSQAEFQDIVRQWLASARDPRFKRP